MFKRDNHYADNLQLLDKTLNSPLSFWLSNGSKFKFNCSEFIFVQRAERNQINIFYIPGNCIAFHIFLIWNQMQKFTSGWLFHDSNFLILVRNILLISWKSELDMIAISNDRNGCSISAIIQAKIHFWNNEQEHSCIRVKYISNRKVVKIYNIISIILHN